MRTERDDRDDCARAVRSLRVQVRRYPGTVSDALLLVWRQRMRLLQAFRRADRWAVRR